MFLIQYEGVNRALVLVKDMFKKHTYLEIYFCSILIMSHNSVRKCVCLFIRWSIFWSVGPLVHSSISPLVHWSIRSAFLLKSRHKLSKNLFCVYKLAGVPDCYMVSLCGSCFKMIKDLNSCYNFIANQAH